jgi:hypothetical protein
LAKLQDWQVPVHALLQQTPCAQMLLSHSSPTLQFWPFGFFPHELRSHTRGDTHWLLLLQLVKQSFALHRKGKQLMERGLMHWPAALQVDSGV